MPKTGALRRILLWSHWLPDPLLAALENEGYRVAALVQGSHPKVPSYSLHDLFYGNPELARLPKRSAPSQWLSDESFRRYARCLPRLGFYPGSHTYETISGGVVDPMDLEDWARWHLNLALQLLDAQAIDGVWFSCPPHLGIDEMMMRAAQGSGRQVLVIRQLRVADKFFVRAFAGERECSLQCPTTAWTTGAPDPNLEYMAAAKQRPLLRTVPGLLRFTRRALARQQQRARERYYLGARARGFWWLLALLELTDVRLRPFAWMRWLLRHRAKRRRAQAGTLRASALPKDFVYFPLHLEPELNTAILGGAYSNQLDAVMALSAKLPEGWRLLLKENPKQGFLQRGEPFWMRLNALDNVDFVDPALGSEELIERARVVATVVGTAGFESLLRGKPCIYFGEAWYAGLPGAVAFSENLNLTQVVEQPIDLETLHQACNTLLSGLADGLVYPWYRHDYTEALACRTAASLRNLSEQLEAMAQC